MRQRHVIAAIAAVVFTLGSAAAAIALNVGAGAPEPTSAGQLATRTLAPPSTLYVDVTVPDLPPDAPPQVDAGSSDVVDATGAVVTGSGSSSAARSGSGSTRSVRSAAPSTSTASTVSGATPTTDPPGDDHGFPDGHDADD